MNEHLRSFKHFLELEKNSAKNTLQSYERDLQRYMKYLEQRGIKAPSDVREEHITKYLRVLHEMGLAPKSIARNLSSIRMFHKFLFGEGVVSGNPAQDIDTPKTARTLPDVLTPHEIEAILDQPDTSGPLGIRDKAILETMYATGVRVSEAIALRRTDVSPDEGVARVFGKG